jgi:hypothetical protein
MKESKNQKNRFFQLLEWATPKYAPSKDRKDEVQTDDDCSEKKIRQRKFANT